MSKKIVIIGANGHGKVAADIARQNGYDQVFFLDDDPARTVCGRDPVVGTSGEIAAYADAEIFVAIGNAAIRRRILSKLLASGFRTATLVHPAAVIAEDVSIGAGTIVAAGAVINPGAVIGTGCIVNTCSSVDHDCVVEDYVHVSVGAHVAGTVRIGCGTWIGAGATVSNNVCIPAGCMIGAGAVVVHDLREPGTYIGVPARKMA